MTMISYPDESWSPVTGCSKVSSGCKNCFAERIATSQGGPVWTPANAGRNVRWHPDRLAIPAGWRKGRLVLTCTMGDLFHELVPLDFLQAVFQVMATTPRHTYLTLTKRAERMRCWLYWPANVWAGVSVENRATLERIDSLRKLPAKRWISVEPLLEDLGTVDLTGISWVVCGGESGPRHRPMDHAWARDLYRQCQAAGVPFYFKQSSAVSQGAGDALILEDGSARIIQEYPTLNQTVQESLF